MDSVKAVVSISPLALQDLQEIKTYIADELESPEAAVKTVGQIMKRIRGLEQFPETGAKLSSIIRTETVYRYLTSGNYMTFYRCEGQTVFVDRVLYGKRDYMKILFEARTE